MQKVIERVRFDFQAKRVDGYLVKENKETVIVKLNPDAKRTMKRHKKKHNVVFLEKGGE